MLVCENDKVEVTYFKVKPDTTLHTLLKLYLADADLFCNDIRNFVSKTGAQSASLLRNSPDGFWATAGLCFVPDQAPQSGYSRTEFGAYLPQDKNQLMELQNIQLPFLRRYLSKKAEEYYKKNKDILDDLRFGILGGEMIAAIKNRSFRPRIELPDFEELFEFDYQKLRELNEKDAPYCILDEYGWEPEPLLKKTVFTLSPEAAKHAQDYWDKKWNENLLRAKFNAAQADRSPMQKLTDGIKKMIGKPAQSAQTSATQSHQP